MWKKASAELKKTVRLALSDAKAREQVFPASEAVKIAVFRANRLGAAYAREKQILEKELTDAGMVINGPPRP